MTTKSNAGQAGTTDTKSTIESTFKDNALFDNNQFINELNRKIKELETPEVKSVSLFDVVSAVGLIVLIIHLILKI